MDFEWYSQQFRIHGRWIFHIPSLPAVTVTRHICWPWSPFHWRLSSQGYSLFFIPTTTKQSLHNFVHIMLPLWHTVLQNCHNLVTIHLWLNHSKTLFSPHINRGRKNWQWNGPLIILRDIAISNQVTPTIHATKPATSLAPTCKTMYTKLWNQKSKTTV